MSKRTQKSKRNVKPPKINKRRATKPNKVKVKVNKSNTNNNHKPKDKNDKINVKILIMPLEWIYALEDDYEEVFEQLKEANINVSDLIKYVMDEYPPKHPYILEDFLYEKTIHTIEEQFLDRDYYVDINKFDNIGYLVNMLSDIHSNIYSSLNRVRPRTINKISLSNIEPFKHWFYFKEKE